jgi:hypothetical protein
MGLYRYSAIETFGIPLTESDVVTLGDGREGLFSILDANDLEPLAVPSEPTDITPHYWGRNNMIYIASLTHPEGPAVVDLLPKYTNVESYLMSKIGSLTVTIPGIRHIRVPTDQRALIIAGGSPRFENKVCLHEVIVERDL